MFHFTIFGRSEAHMPPSGLFSMTVFGGTTLRRATLAQRALELEVESARRQTWLQRVTDSSRNTALTLFGTTEVMEPTLMEEYSALTSVIATRAIAADELARRLRVLSESVRDEELTTLTVFGGFLHRRPSLRKQFQALENGEKAGLISKAHRRRLDDVADAAPSACTAVLGGLVAEMA